MFSSKSDQKQNINMDYHDDEDAYDNNKQQLDYNSKERNMNKNKAGSERTNPQMINSRFASNARSISQQLDDEQQFEETQQFLQRTKELAAEEEKRKSVSSSASLKRKQKALLAKQETLEEGGAFVDGDKKSLTSSTTTLSGSSGYNVRKCFGMFFNFVKRKRIFIPIIIISLIAAIYCIPYVEIETRIPQPLPIIPFNFGDGPLKESTASQFKVDRLFYEQIYGPESIALDSMGNMYMAVEGGFILYAHLNKSSPIKRSYYDDASLLKNRQAQQQYESSFPNYYQQQQQPAVAGAGGGATTTPLNQQLSIDDIPELVKIAELNAIKLWPYNYYNSRGGSSTRRARGESSSGGVWRRECQLDEKIYGEQLAALVEPTTVSNGAQSETVIRSGNGEGQRITARKFRSNVVCSRCSKPLGIRLSPDESYLYVIDTLSGLYKISLKVSERPNLSQRLVSKLIDFKNTNGNGLGRQLLPVVHLDKEQSATLTRGVVVGEKRSINFRTVRNEGSFTANNITLTKLFNVPQLNISLMAIDDLVIDYGAGARGGDIIYMSDASQTWQATSFVYDMLEGRPSGAILRFDTGLNQLSVLDPKQVSRVRTSISDINNQSSRLYSTNFHTNNDNNNNTNDNNDYNNEISAYMGIGAPRLDENDVFDDRPLHFANGLELTDDKQALLIADSINKRIIKHYIRGSRRGTSDLWAWTPNFPDNIRRGYDKNQETYWVTGCGHDTSKQYFDLTSLLNSYPRLRKYLLKNIYLFGWLIEQFGTHVMGSVSIRDYGYQLKIGSSLCESMCPGMMILQYNRYGDIIRSIHSKEFPNDLVYYSQANEIIDSKNQEHILYLSSPSYKYVTKLVLPTDSSLLPPTDNIIPFR